MSWLWRALVSIRTTAIIIVVLAILLLLNVTIPQAGVDPQGYAKAVRGGGIGRFLVMTLGLGAMSTSRVFLATLALFFVNLAAVLVARTRATLRRLRFTVPTTTQLDALLADAGTLPASCRTGPESLRRARRLLETLGYATFQPSEGTLWAVRHRLALIGFPLFHLSFFVLAVGGGMLYLTRSVVNVVAAEGQTVDSAVGHVVRRAPLGQGKPVRLSVEHVEVHLEDGKPIDLTAAIRLDDETGDARIARINHPAAEGDLTVLVERAGIAPVLWLVDERGFTLDRVAVIATGDGGLPTRLRLGEGEIEAVIEPIHLGRSFPERPQLARVPVGIRLRRGDRIAFDGWLRPGDAVEVGGRSVRLQEVRYWAELALVRESGGGLLIAGFLLAIGGIVWRMAWHRRDVAVAWDDGRLRIGGRSEFYPGRFRAELEELRALVAKELAREERA